MTENVNESKPSRIVFCKDKYESEIEMWEDIDVFLQILMKNEYVAVIRCDEQSLGIYCIDYGYADPQMGCEMPFWLSDDEVERLEAEAEKGESDAEVH